ncbi:hypothetical protein KJ865_12005, partial [Myxococcota bacterium]|nr:hypothetical protein [Myxococcota bacterium]
SPVYVHRAVPFTGRRGVLHGALYGTADRGLQVGNLSVPLTGKNAVAMDLRRGEIVLTVNGVVRGVLPSGSGAVKNYPDAVAYDLSDLSGPDLKTALDALSGKTGLHVTLKGKEHLGILARSTVKPSGLTVMDPLGDLSLLRFENLDFLRLRTARELTGRAALGRVSSLELVSSPDSDLPLVKVMERMQPRDSSIKVVRLEGKCDTALLRRIVKMHPRVLEIREQFGSDVATDYSQIASIKGLRAFTLQRITADSVDLSSLQTMASLVSLTLKTRGTITTASLGLPSGLTTLRLAGDINREIFSAASFPSLTRLELEARRGNLSLDRIPASESLRELRLEGVAVRTLAPLKKLHSLHLTDYTGKITGWSGVGGLSLRRLGVEHNADLVQELPRAGSIHTLRLHVLGSLTLTCGLEQVDSARCINEALSARATAVELFYKSAGSRESAVLASRSMLTYLVAGGKMGLSVLKTIHAWKSLRFLAVMTPFALDDNARLLAVRKHLPPFSWFARVKGLPLFIENPAANRDRINAVLR